MIYYILLIGYAIICMSNINGIYLLSKKTSVILLSIPMFLLSAFRDTSIGPDTISYYYSFNYISNYSSLSEAIASSRMEPGYVALNYFFSYLGLTYFHMQIVISAFVIGSIAYFVYLYSDSVAFSFFLFLANNLLFGTMNVVRMWIAVSILLFSIRPIQSGKVLQFCFMIMIASLFHYSSLIFLLLYPFTKIKINFKKIAVSFLISVLICVFAIPFFTYLTNKIGNYSNYVNSTRFDTSDNIAVKISLAISICFFILATYTKCWIDNDGGHEGKSGKQKFYIFSLAYSAMIISVCIDLIGLSNNIMGRIGYYFSVYNLILIPHSIFLIYKPKNRRIMTFLILLLLSLKFIIIMKFRPEWFMVTPYKTFIFS